MSDGPSSAPEGVLPSEQQTTSPTEVSDKWEVNYSPSLRHVLAATAAFLVFATGWGQGHIDMETSKMAMEQGLLSVAVLKGMLGAAEVAAGISGGIAGGVWAKRGMDRQLDNNPKPR